MRGYEWEVIGIERMRGSEFEGWGIPLNFLVSGKIQVMTVSWSTADFGRRSIAWQFSLWLHLVFWCSYLEQSLLKLFLEDIMSLPEM